MERLSDNFSFLVDLKHIPFEQCREVSHLAGKLQSLTSRENVFCSRAFTGRCNRRYIPSAPIKLCLKQQKVFFSFILLLHISLLCLDDVRILTNSFKILRSLRINENG